MTPKLSETEMSEFMKLPAGMQDTIRQMARSIELMRNVRASKADVSAMLDSLNNHAKAFVKAHSATK
jgi:hypothetical protein